MERDWLVTIRQQLEMSQKEVAERVGIAQASYCTIEKGQTAPRVDTAKKIAEVLGFDWTRFFDQEE